MSLSSALFSSYPSLSSLYTTPFHVVSIAHVCWDCGRARIRPTWAARCFSGILFVITLAARINVLVAAHCTCQSHSILARCVCHVLHTAIHAGYAGKISVPRVHIYFSCFLFFFFFWRWWVWLYTWLFLR